LRENDWKQALLITSFIPSTFTKFRKQLVYQILQMKAIYVLKELPIEGPNQCDFQLWILSTVKIPRQFFHSARAMIYQYQRHHESAMNDWK
jgi:hypothetical protein